MQRTTLNTFAIFALLLGCAGIAGAQDASNPSSAGPTVVALAPEANATVPNEVQQATLEFVITAPAGIAGFTVSRNGQPLVEATTRAAIVKHRAPATDVPADDQPLTKAVQRVEVEFPEGSSRFTVTVTDTTGATDSCAWVIERERASGQTYLLCIGCRYYANYGELPLADSDAQAVYRTMIEIGGIAQPNSRLLVSERSEATRDAMLDALDWLASVAQSPSDTVIMYYSGHGMRQGDRYFMVPQDATDNLTRSGIDVALLQDYWNRIAARNKIFIADSCHAEGFRLRGEEGGAIDFRRGFTGRGRALLLAASEDQTAAELPGDPHALFTLHLLYALRGKADGFGDNPSDGVVTLREVKDYLDSYVATDAERRGNGKQQQPYIEVGGDSSLPLTWVAGVASDELPAFDDALIFMDPQSPEYVHELKFELTVGIRTTISTISEEFSDGREQIMGTLAVLIDVSEEFRWPGSWLGLEFSGTPDPFGLGNSEFFWSLGLRFDKVFRENQFAFAINLTLGVMQAGITTAVNPILHEAIFGVPMPGSIDSHDYQGRSPLTGFAFLKLRIAHYFTTSLSVTLGASVGLSTLHNNLEIFGHKVDVFAAATAEPFHWYGLYFSIAGGISLAF